MDVWNAVHDSMYLEQTRRWPAGTECVGHLLVMFRVDTVEYERGDVADEHDRDLSGKDQRWSVLSARIRTNSFPILVCPEMMPFPHSWIWFAQPRLWSATPSLSEPISRTDRT